MPLCAKIDMKLWDLLYRRASKSSYVVIEERKAEHAEAYEKNRKEIDLIFRLENQNFYCTDDRVWVS